MTNEEILEAAKEAGCQAKTDGFITYRDEPIGNMLERFAAIIERRMLDKLSAGGVLVRLNRPEGYEDVHPELVADDAINDRWEWYDVITQKSAN